MKCRPSQINRMELGRTNLKIISGQKNMEKPKSPKTEREETLQRIRLLKYLLSRYRSKLASLSEKNQDFVDMEKESLALEKKMHQWYEKNPDAESVLAIKTCVYEDVDPDGYKRMVELFKLLEEHKAFKKIQKYKQDIRQLECTIEEENEEF